MILVLKQNWWKNDNEENHGLVGKICKPTHEHNINTYKFVERNVFLYANKVKDPQISVFCDLSQIYIKIFYMNNICIL